MKRLILFVVFLSFNLTANSILIKSGQIHDGQGDSFIGDILITDNKIVEVGTYSTVRQQVLNRSENHDSRFKLYNEYKYVFEQ